MRQARPRGLTIAEVLVYAFLAGVVTTLLVKFLMQYNVISGSFNVRNTLNNTATQLFAQMGSQVKTSNAQGVQVSADGLSLSIQKATDVDSLGRTDWQQALTVYWYDVKTESVCYGTVLFTDAKFQELLYSPRATTDVERALLIEKLKETGKWRVAARNVTTFEASKPGTEELLLRLKLSKPSRDKRIEVAERQHSYTLLTDGEI